MSLTLDSVKKNWFNINIAIDDKRPNYSNFGGKRPDLKTPEQFLEEYDKHQEEWDNCDYGLLNPSWRNFCLINFIEFE